MITGNGQIRICKKEEDQEMDGINGCKKRIRCDKYLYYVSHSDSNHYALQTHTKTILKARFNASKYYLSFHEQHTLPFVFLKYHSYSSHFPSLPPPLPLEKSYHYVIQVYTELIL